jgi:formiminotetrahydrofolate cyclodeaminase
MEGALANVEINLASIKDLGFTAEIRKRAEAVKI